MWSTELYVQRVLIQWTKASRGMPGAADRNRCPTSFVLSANELQALATRTGYSHVTQCEASAFVAQKNVVPHTGGVQPNWSTVMIKQHKAGGPVVQYQYVNYLVGAPDRSHRPALSCRLVQGELVRVEYNGRFAEPGTNWYYVRHIDNIVWTVRPTAAMFLAAPAHHLTDLAELF